MAFTDITSNMDDMYSNLYANKSYNQQKNFTDTQPVATTKIATTPKVNSGSSWTGADTAKAIGVGGQLITGLVGTAANYFMAQDQLAFEKSKFEDGGYYSDMAASATSQAQTAAETQEASQANMEGRLALAQKEFDFAKERYSNLTTAGYVK